MGACLSCDDSGNTKSGSYKPCPAWTSEIPMTMEQLLKDRETFWSTQPAYGGDPNIWNILKEVCSLPFKKQKAILETANLSVPTGRLIDGCYDETGCLYVIPPYCLSEPNNLIRDDNSTSKSSLNKNDSSAIDNSEPIKAPTGADITLTFRFSSGKDLKLDTNDGFALSDLIPQMNIAQNTTPRFFHMGKELDKRTSIKSLDIPTGSIIQAMVVNSYKVS